MIFGLAVIGYFVAHATKPFKLVVFGGSGRVGGSAVRALNDNSAVQFDVTVVGRDPRNWEQYLGRLQRTLPCVSRFASVDVRYASSELDNLISESDLVIHTAGPFQGQLSNKVFESAVRHGVDYLDVCDDIKLSRMLRNPSYKELARQSGSRAIISTGIWPGCSSLLANEIIEAAGGSDEVNRVEFAFFTAGSGWQIEIRYNRYVLQVVNVMKVAPVKQF
jgi:saccharopine dehydrogenase-like NADP-dependent oxidoreductase